MPDLPRAWEACRADFVRAVASRTGSDATRIKYERTLARFFSDPAKTPEQYTRADVEAFLHAPCADVAHRGKPPSAGTMNNRLSVLSSFYSYAANYGILGADGALHPLLTTLAPTAGLRQVQRDRAYRTIAPADFARLFAAMPTDTVKGLRDRAIFLTLFWTARRRAEITALRYGDIEPAVFVDGNGARRAGYQYHFYGKGHARERDTAELPMPAYAAIRRYLEASGRLPGIRPDDPVFAVTPLYRARGNDTHTPMQPASIWRILKEYAAAAGLDPASLCVHSFRHSAVQQRYAAGEDILSLQRLLRHASLATTSVYLQALVGTADAGASRLEAAFARYSTG